MRICTVGLNPSTSLIGSAVGGEGPQTQLVAFGNRVRAGGRLRVGNFEAR